MTDGQHISPEKYGKSVRIHGSLSKLNYVDADVKALMIERLSIAGHFGQRSHMTGCREVDLLSDGGINDHDGFSGCPVFLASSEFKQPNPSLIGINLRGSAAKRKKHYLDVFALKFLIDHHLEHGTPRPCVTAE